MTTKTNTITLERQSAWTGALGSMHIVIDDEISTELENGETAKLMMPNNQKECTVQVKDHVFRVVNLKQVKKIVLKFSFNGIDCSILYRDGHVVNAINKNPGADVTKTIMIVLLILFIFVFPLSQCSSLFFIQ